MLIAEHGLQGPEIAIHLSDDRLASMNDWCKEHHGQSGLTEQCRASSVSLEQAEDQVQLSRCRQPSWHPVLLLSLNSVLCVHLWLQLPGKLLTDRAGCRWWPSSASR